MIFMDEKKIYDNGISIVVPFLNEKDGLGQYCVSLDEYSSEKEFKIELIFVDDGSTDGSADIVKGFNFKNIERVRVIRLSRNYGMHAAIRAGLLEASYEICTWMGSDLQEPIEFIEKSYDLIKDGYDAVYIDKKTVGVSHVNRLFSKIYTHMMKKYAVRNYTDGGTSVIVFNAKIRDYLNNNIENNSSIMLQIMDAGFKSYTLSMDFGERTIGQSKWSLTKKIKLFIDSFVAFSFMPIRLVSVVGIIMFVSGLIYWISIIIKYLCGIKTPMGYPTIASLLVLGFGITNISLGIIAEYLWRTYDAARNRPAFIVADRTLIK